jgi:hypothetical protein
LAIVGLFCLLLSGYYVASYEGITIVWVQGRPHDPPVTVHLDTTVAPGATQWHGSAAPLTPARR